MKTLHAPHYTCPEDFLAGLVTDADRDRALDAAVAAYLEAGVTGAVDMGMRADDLAALERAAADGRLGIRVAAHWLIAPTGDPVADLAQVDEARAHDAQAWLLACDQAWTPPRGKAALGIGRSALLDPSGGVRARLDHAPGLLVGDIDLEAVTATRRRVPLL